MALPYVHPGIVVACHAEGHGITVPAPVVPDVKDPAFPAQCLPAAVADDNGLVDSAHLADPVFNNGYHRQMPAADEYVYCPRQDFQDKMRMLENGL
jgi:hypothetical protein